MSDTRNKSNTAIACGDIKLKGKGIIIDQGKYGPSRNDINQLAGIKIKFGEENECIVTNETETGEVAMIDKKTGELISYLEGDGDIGKKLDRMDKKALKGLNNLNDKKDTGDKEK